jgi:hypothetical protein
LVPKVWIVDAHRDGQWFAIDADEEADRILELESAIRAASPQLSFRIRNRRGGTRLTLGHLGQDLFHLRGRKSAHRLRTDVAQHICCQQHTGGRLIVRSLEDAHLVVLTERPIHLLDSDSHRLDFGGPSGHPLGRLLSALDALVGEFHQTDVVGLIFSVPATTFDLDSSGFELASCGLSARHSTVPKKQSAKINLVVFVFMRRSNLDLHFPSTFFVHRRTIWIVDAYRGRVS